jgi:hypothetical protein
LLVEPHFELGSDLLSRKRRLSEVSDAIPRTRNELMGLSRRINLRLDAVQHAAVVAYGQQHGLRPSPAARHLIGEALAAAAPGGTSQPASLAALVAAEHAVLMVASVLPEGESRMRALAERASAAAEARLAMFVEPAAPGSE